MEANVEKIKKLSCEQLIAVLQDGELEQRIIDVLRGQNIAGRHIARVKREDLASMLGLSLGDFFDLEDALETGLSFVKNNSSITNNANYTNENQREISAISKAPEISLERAVTNYDNGNNEANDANHSIDQSLDKNNSSIANIANCPNENQGEISGIGSTPEVSMERAVISVDNESNDEANAASHWMDQSPPVSPSKENNLNMSNLSLSPNMETNSDLSNASSDAVLPNSGSKETVKEMDSYHKQVAKAQIDKLNFLTSKDGCRYSLQAPCAFIEYVSKPVKRNTSTVAAFGSASTSKDTTRSPISVRRKISSVFGSASTSTDITMNNPANSEDEDIANTSTSNRSLRSTTGFPPCRSSMTKDAGSNKPSTSATDTEASCSSATMGSETTNPSQPSSSRKTPKQTVPKKPILEEQKKILEADNLTEAHKALIKYFIQSPVNYTFTIYKILESAEKVEDEWLLLQRDGVVFGKILEKLLRFLVQHLYTLVPNPNLVSPEMRESIAVCLVASFPKLGQNPSRTDEKPWSWLYNRDTNMDKIANIVQNRQRTQKQKRLRGGGTERRKRSKSADKPVQVALPQSNTIPDGELSKDAKFLKLLAANDSNKPEILNKMESTFEERRSIVCNDKYTVSAVLKAFHHLRSFKGEMVELEFRRLHAGKENKFLLDFPEVALKLVALAQQERLKYQDCFKFSDNNLNALLVLKKFLPKAARCYPYENLMDPTGKLSELIEVIPVGSNVQNVIETRRQHAKATIQPYLLAVGSNAKLESILIVLGDSQFIQLPKKTEPIRAIDMLIKVHYVINTHFYLGWKNVYRFLTAHIYTLPPENKRLSVFTEKWLQLQSMQLD